VKPVPYTLLAAMLIFACSGKSPDTVKSYPIRGEVVKIDSASSRITIAHHEIPGLMKAMTMAFRAKHPALLNIASVGDSISGTLSISGEEAYLDTLIVFWRSSAEMK
jgi:Cu/Ag efflux protein CusF